MSKKYVIQWKSKVNGRAGRGTKLFDLEEAQRLVAELNAEYPDIQHETLDSEKVPRKPPEPAEAAADEADTAGAKSAKPLHAFSAP